VVSQGRTLRGCQHTALIGVDQPQTPDFIPPDLGPILAALPIDRNDGMRYSCTWIASPKQQTSNRPDTCP